MAHAIQPQEPTGRADWAGSGSATGSPHSELLAPAASPGLEARRHQEQREKGVEPGFALQ